MSDRTIGIDGVQVPRFLYGTAWKEDETQRLTELALRQGFRGIDTANQRRHYHEAAVGQAIQAAISSGLVKRGDLFLQTKFTFQGGQDHRLPYAPKAPIAVQVNQSFESSLHHLNVTQIDSFVLHGPTSARVWRLRTGKHGEPWRLFDSKRTTFLGISNVTADQLKELCQKGASSPFCAESLLRRPGVGLAGT